MTQSLAARVANRALTASRVADRFLHRASGYDGKFVGKDCRLQWSRHSWVLEELPQKGKKKLRAGELQNPSSHGHFDWWIPGNILQMAKLTPSDTFDKIESKVADAYKEAYERTQAGKDERDKAWLAQSDWVKELKWYEKEVFYLNVTPEGVDDFTVEGKDFSVKVTWRGFSTYSPNSDFQQADPHYSQIESKSPTAARKFYLMLKNKPDALKSVSWHGLTDWLRQQKIQYNMNHSQWT